MCARGNICKMGAAILMKRSHRIILNEQRMVFCMAFMSVKAGEGFHLGGRIDIMRPYAD